MTSSWLPAPQASSLVYTTSTVVSGLIHADSFLVIINKQLSSVPPFVLCLQGPVSGSKKPAIEGQLIILAAGDKGLFDECKDAFAAMGKRSLYLGPVGAGASMKLVVNMVMGSMMGEWCCWYLSTVVRQVETLSRRG